MRRAGFTFIELLIALTVFLVGMISVLQIFPANRKLLNETTHNTQAAFLAQQELESVRALPYATLTTGTYLAKSAVTANTSSPYAMFSQSVSIDYLDTNRNVTGNDLGLKRITVTIYWAERSLNLQYVASTYVQK